MKKINVRIINQLVTAEETHIVPCEAGCPNLGVYVHKEKFYCYPHFVSQRSIITPAKNSNA